MRRCVYIVSTVSNLLVRLPEHALHNVDYTNPRIVVRWEAVT